MREVLRTAVAGLVVVLIATVLLSTLIVGNYTRQFLAASALSWSDVFEQVRLARQTYPTRAAQRANFLVLGLDRRMDGLENTNLTDAIIFMSYLPRTAAATLIPLPRDLWIADLKVKINAMYYYGRQNGQGASYVADQVSKLTGQPIDHYLVLDYQKLPSFINLIGGVDTEVERSFTDETFPNQDHITNPKAPIYITVKFTKGWNHMDGETALQYVRSRTSKDLSEAGDTARSKRQLRLIQAVAKKFSDPKIFTNPKLLGEAYKFFHQAVETNLTDSDLLALALASWPSHEVVVSAVPVPAALLVNPSISKYGQWVWELRNPTGGELRDFFDKVLEE